ncbi:MAG: hypothetical protein HETSPECPRED_010452 [Heterodermia speciosa]|uniref:Ribonucleases P/MRP subunit Pop8-like domain-containing protein n=1 Tax=Heterodermia speciosa TaxID=116794 RepID=A0A8H3G8L9_9LECA|nr:MAG: hypothetical protein HETSPECPRED_010452 [Heterodermia speciosa]
MPASQSFTIRDFPFTYLHLTLLSTSPSPPPLDGLTAHKHLTAALRQFLGITGTAIPIDILKVDDGDVWIRVPREDGAAVAAALGNWVDAGEGVSWRIRGRGQWLGALVARTGLEKVWGK